MSIVSSSAWLQSAPIASKSYAKRTGLLKLWMYIFPETHMSWMISTRHHSICFSVYMQRSILSNRTHIKHRYLSSPFTVDAIGFCITLWITQIYSAHWCLNSFMIQLSINISHKGPVTKYYPRPEWWFGCNAQRYITQINEEPIYRHKYV